MQLAILDNEIAEGDYKQNNEVTIELSDSEKTQYNNNWRTYCKRNVLLMKHRGQGILSHPWSVHSIASRQNEAGYQLKYGKHIIQSFGFVLTYQENDTSTNGGSIPICNCV
jgi:hypothetical protein